MGWTRQATRQQVSNFQHRQWSIFRALCYKSKPYSIYSRVLTSDRDTGGYRDNVIMIDR